MPQRGQGALSGDILGSHNWLVVVGCCWDLRREAKVAKYSINVQDSSPHFGSPKCQ